MNNGQQNTNAVTTPKQFVIKVIKYRQNLLKKGDGYLSPGFKQDMKNILYNAANSKNAANLLAYLREKKEVFQYIIPANKKSWRQTFNQLIET